MFVRNAFRDRKLAFFRNYIKTTKYFCNYFQNV